MRRFCQRLLCATLSMLALNSPEIWAQSADQASHPVPTASIQQVASAELPDSPSAVWAQAEQAQSQSSTQPSSTSALPSSSQTDSQPANPQSVSPVQQQSASPAQSQPSPPQRPVGTAAAEAPVVSGITAAQPSGVAVAPAKQRRVRTIVLRVGAIAAAGVALGATIALTEGTSSKPPGAH
ncbi:MAG TPA: hypothetical protein VMH04_18470 [Candidatus Solibacter sp.]|nr:hypothetical protein [Candidatus Solibacter sp.]